MSKVSPTVRKQKWPLYLRADDRQLKIPPMTQDGVHYFRFFLLFGQALWKRGFLFPTQHTQHHLPARAENLQQINSLCQSVGGNRYVRWTTVIKRPSSAWMTSLCICSQTRSPLLHSMICAFKLLSKIAATHLCEREETAAKTSYYL